MECGNRLLELGDVKYTIAMGDRQELKCASKLQALLEPQEINMNWQRAVERYVRTNEEEVESRITYVHG